MIHCNELRTLFQDKEYRPKAWILHLAHPVLLLIQIGKLEMYLEKDL